MPFRRFEKIQNSVDKYIQLTLCGGQLFLIIMLKAVIFFERLHL